MMQPSAPDAPEGASHLAPSRFGFYLLSALKYLAACISGAVSVPAVTLLIACVLGGINVYIFKGRLGSEDSHDYPPLYLMLAMLIVGLVTACFLVRLVSRNLGILVLFWMAAFLSFCCLSVFFLIGSMVPAP